MAIDSEKIVDQLVEFIAAPMMVQSTKQLQELGAPEEFVNAVCSAGLRMTRNVLMDKLSEEEVLFLWNFHTSEQGKKLNELSLRVNQACLEELPQFMEEMFSSMKSL